MGKALLMLVGAFVITGGSLIYSSVNQGSIKNTEKVGAYASELTAREIAHTGIADAILKLSQAYQDGGSYTGPLTWKGSYQGGSYTNTVSISGMDHTIQTVSKIDGREYVIEREYRITPGAGLTPPSMSKALTSEKSITFNHDAVIQHVNMSSTSENADIQTNESIIIHNGLVCVFGFGLRENNLDIFNGQTESSIFLPPTNPDSAPLSPVTPAVEIPEFDAATYEPSASVSHSTNLDLSGYHTLGTEDNPALWYVDGDLTTSGNVTLSGYGIITVTGNVDINHYIYTDDGPSGTGSNAEGSVAFYTDSNVILNKNAEAHFYANGSITIANYADITGTLSTRDQFNINGFTNIYYRPPAAAITTPIFGGGASQVELLSTREWAVDDTGLSGATASY